MTDDYAYVADGEQGIVIINIIDKSNPFISGNFNTSGNAKGIFVDGNYAYVADEDEGLAIINISDKSFPLLAAYYDTEGSAENISIFKNYAYVADGKNGLHVIDITDPDQPVAEKAWSYNSPGFATDVISGYITEDEESFAFIAGGASGIIAVNLSVDDGSNETTSGSSGGCFVQTLTR